MDTAILTNNEINRSFGAHCRCPGNLFTDHSNTTSIIVLDDIAQVICKFSPRPDDVEFHVANSLKNTVMNSISSEQLQNLAQGVIPVQKRLDKLLLTVKNIANRKDVGDPYDVLYLDITGSSEAVASLLLTVDNIVRSSGMQMLLEFAKELAYHPMVHVMQVMENSTAAMADRMSNFKHVLNVLS